MIPGTSSNHCNCLLGVGLIYAKTVHCRLDKARASIGFADDMDRGHSCPPLDKLQACATWVWPGDCARAGHGASLASGSMIRA
jgi:hypothetical protein